MNKLLLAKNISLRISSVSLFLLLFLMQKPVQAGVYYWVGGTGKWSQFNTHWATTSGGLVFHVQTPTPNDTAIFDANSFTMPNDTVYIDQALTTITCYDMIWTNVTNNPTFFNANATFNIFGSLALSPNMNWHNSNIYFKAITGNHTIKSTTKNVGAIYFNTASQWTLLDSLNCSSINFNAGSFISNNYLIRCSNGLNFLQGVNISVLLGTSYIICGAWNLSSNLTQLNLDVDSCTIYSEGLGADFYAGANHVYHNIIISGYTHAQSCTFNYIYAPQNVHGSFDTDFTNNSVDSIFTYDIFEMYGTGNILNIVNISSSAYVDMGSNNTYHYANINTAATIGSNNMFSHINILGNVSIAGGNTFQYIHIVGNASIGGNNSYDTLYFDNPGGTITLQHGTTQSISKEFTINANGGFPVTLQSNLAGTQATIYKATDTVCLNFIYIQDVNAIGGAQFYAGQYSSNISNNTGWIWTDCSQAFGNVWPGDANHDLITNNLDIVYIGIAYNATGFTRANASLTYTAQPCFNWNSIYTNFVNVNHADCDGNGIVNANDTTAVSLNYGIANTGRMAQHQQTQSTNSTPDLYLAPMQTTYAQGTLVSIPINLGTSGTPVSNIYGLAFTLQYDASQIEAGSVSISYNNSWLVPINNIVHLEKDFYSGSHIDVGMARTNHANISGNGTIAYLNFQVASTATNGPINISFSDVTVMDVNQTLIPVNALTNSVTVGINTITASISELKVYPNPAQNKLEILIDNEQIKEVKLFDVLGKEALSTKEKEMDVSNLNEGVYFLHVKTSSNFYTKKVVISH